MIQSITRRGLIAGGFTAIATANSARARVDVPQGDLIPVPQRLFAQTLDHFWRLAQIEGTAVDRREALLRRRGEALRAALSGQAVFTRWLCTRTLASRMSDGSVYVILGVGAPKADVDIRFSNFDALDKRDAKLRADSEVGSALLAMKDRDAMLVTGRLFVDDRDGFVEGVSVGQRKTSDQEFRSPGFLAAIDAVEQPAWLQDLAARTRRP